VDIVKQPPVRSRIDSRLSGPGSKRLIAQQPDIISSRDHPHHQDHRTRTTAVAAKVKGRPTEGQSDDTDCDVSEQPGVGLNKSACAQASEELAAASSPRQTKTTGGSQEQNYHHNTVNNNTRSNNNNVVNPDSYEGLRGAGEGVKAKKKKKKKERGTCLRSAKAREDSLTSGAQGADTLSTSTTTTTNSSSSTSSLTSKSDRFSCLAGPRIPNR